jgi:hypothetical protein
VPAIDGAIGVAALAWHPTEGAGHAGKVPIRLDKGFPAIVSHQEIGAAVAGLKVDGHAAWGTIRDLFPRRYRP